MRHRVARHLLHRRKPDIAPVARFLKRFPLAGRALIGPSASASGAAPEPGPRCAASDRPQVRAPAPRPGAPPFRSPRQRSEQ